MRYLSIEYFFIDKNTGLINYNEKRYKMTLKKWNKHYAKKQISKIAKEDSQKNLVLFFNKNHQNLTKQDVYNLYPGFWTFYGGFGERVKKLINASKNASELKNMAENERSLWKKTVHR